CARLLPLVAAARSGDGVAPRLRSAAASPRQEDRNVLVERVRGGARLALTQRRVPRPQRPRGTRPTRLRPPQARTFTPQSSVPAPPFQSARLSSSVSTPVQCPVASTTPSRWSSVQVFWAPTSRSASPENTPPLQAAAAREPRSVCVLTRSWIAPR